jgi:hypothetical protein
MTAPAPQPRRRPTARHDGKATVAEALIGTLSTDAEWNRAGTDANVVDALAAISRAIHHLAEAVEGTYARE